MNRLKIFLHPSLLVGITLMLAGLKVIWFKKFILWESLLAVDQEAILLGIFMLIGGIYFIAIWNRNKNKILSKIDNETSRKIFINQQSTKKGETK